MTIKLFFFDLEGTLVVPHNVDRPGDGHNMSLWSKIFQTLGPEALAEDDIGVLKWENNEHNYIEWCEYSLKLFKKYGLTHSQLQQLIAETAITPGAVEVLAALHAKGIRTAIISGGLINQAKHTQLQLDIPHSFAASELFFDENGAIIGWNILPSDNAAKADYVELLRRECNIAREECAFVGDGKNDTSIANLVGLSFAYRAHPKLQAVATHCISDFRDILKQV